MRVASCTLQLHARRRTRVKKHQIKDVLDQTNAVSVYRFFSDLYGGFDECSLII